jgi:hypothetical protein
MSEVLKREHAFISYSHKDETIARNVRNDLEAAGIATWMDDKLEPGTPIWEQAIRDALKSSLAVILIASPNAKEGPYVRGELHLAESHRLEVLPLWMEGNTWIDCVPFSLSDTQYIDGRHSRYATGLVQLVKKLQRIVEDRSPKHCLLTKASNEEYRRIIGKYRATYKFKKEIRASLREDYIYIKLNNGDVVAMRHTAYESFGGLLDDLYMNYLRDHYDYQLFTYGNEWLLGTYGNSSWSLIQLLVPWRWLSLPKNCSLGDEERGWSDFSPQIWFTSYHLRHLQVLDKLLPFAFGLATQTSRTAAEQILFGKEGFALNRHLYKMLEGKYPSTNLWFQQRVMLAQRPEEIHLEDYQHHFIATGSELLDLHNHVLPGEVTRVACILRQIGTS